MARLEPSLSHVDRVIHVSRATTLRLYLAKMHALDPSTDWATLVTTAREAGVSKERFCQTLSCSWSTVTRWMAGQTMPGPFTREAMKLKLIEMAEALHDEQRRLAGTAMGRSDVLDEIMGMTREARAASR